jgi:hypothetical protein
MNAHEPVRIAGSRTTDDWKACKAGLTVGEAPDQWTSAFRDFFYERMETRYFAPIRAIDAIRKSKGEGFSIVAIQCSLIEFLGSTLEGTSYKYRPDKEIPLGPYEYDDSGNLFTRFLTTATPFKAVFTKALAKDFYKSVRCGLLHEARTKNRWTILSVKAPDPFIDAKDKIIYRNDLQDAFIAFTDWYGSELPKNKEYQDAFIRKFDSLCAD